ncbi:MAG: caspase family protein [Prevotella sp.]|nr:caspase family protein [Prevotella sp.]
MSRLPLTIIGLLLTLSSAYCHTYIVCVGVADYPGEKNDLRLSATDALTMSELYSKNGDATVRLFQNEEATAANVTAAFSQLCGQAAADDAVIFFFSGHGMPGTFVCYDAQLRYDEVVNALSTSAAKTKIIFADACFAGKARTSNRRHATADDFSQTSVLFFLSSRTDETSKENRLMHNSLFTAYLERGLRGGADTNLDRTITAYELFSFVSEGVQQKSRQKQHPVMWGRFPDDMPLMKW